MFSYKIEPNLELRLLEDRHSEAFFNLIDQNRAYLLEWVYWVDRVRSAEDARGFIKNWLQQFARNDGFVAGIWFRGELAGIINLNYIHWFNRCTNIGFWLGESFQGKGIVTKACQALIDYTFQELGLYRIEMDPPTMNVKSCAVAERLGFTREGILRKKWVVKGRFIDGVLYSLLADEWRLASNQGKF